MKVSQATVAVLKNFATINPNVILVKSGKLFTISPQRSLIANIAVEEEFPVDFGIYDLNQFLNVLSLFEDPDIEFEEKFVKIKQGRNSIKYYAANVEILFEPMVKLFQNPEKQIKFPAADVTFNLPANILTQALKTAGVLGASDFQIVGKDGKLSLIVRDMKVDTSNQYSQELDSDAAVPDFQANFKIENLKMIPQDYTVELSAKKLARWTSVDGAVYFVALESTSEF